MAVKLQDPSWSESASICVQCGYSLAGLQAQGACPECGAQYEARQLVLWGVPRSTGKGSSPGRRVLWALLIAASVVQYFTWVFQMLYIRWMVLLTSAALLGGYITMLVTGPRERSGSERFIVTPTGIARVAAKFEPGSSRLDTLFVPWGHSTHVEFRRVSSKWKRLRIGRLSEGVAGNLRDVIFDAGIRCPDEQAELVRGTIVGYIANGRAGQNAGQWPA